MSEYIPVAIRRVIIARAKGRCEYCACLESYAMESFAVEHIVPKAAGGHSG